MGFTEILTILFIALKLFGVISWSWWLVLLPEIIMGVIYIALLVYPLLVTHKISKETRKCLRDFDRHF